jgi:hypothetical protein
VDSSTTPVVVKYVVPPRGMMHASSEARSHRRKLRSYEVERAFYRSYAERCGPAARVPAAFHVGGSGDRTLLVLEDLDAAGFGLRRHRVSTVTPRSRISVSRERVTRSPRSIFSTSAAAWA